MPSDILIRFLGDTKEFNAKLAETEAKLGNFGKKAEGAGKTLTSQFGPVAVAAVAAVAVVSLELADKFDVVRTRLETVTHAVGQNFDDFKGKVDDTDHKMANLGFSAIDVEGSLASLTAATHDLGKATQLEGLAADLARFKHESLADATGLLVQVEAGRLRGLAKLGISTKDATGATITSEEAIRRLTAVVGGQATAYTKTLAGQFDVLKANLTNAGIALGEKLMPALNGLISGITSGLNDFKKFNDALDGWPGKLLAVAAAATVATLALSGLTGLVAKLPLVGAGLSSMLGPLAAVVGAFIALHAVGHIFATDTSETAKATIELAGGLKVLGGSGTTSAVVVKDLGEDFKKLAGDIRDVNSQRLTGAFGWVDALIRVSGVTNSSTDGLNRTQNALLSLAKTDPKDAIAAFAKIKEGLIAQGLSADTVDKAFGKYEKTIGILAQVLGPVSSAQVKQAQATATQAAATRALNTSLGKYGEAAGTLAEKIVGSMHLSKSAVDDLAKTTQEFNDGIDKAFTAAGDTIQAWQDKSSFNLGAFEHDLFADTIAQVNWSRNIAILSDAGINKGFLKTLIDAGPKSAKVLQGLVDGVSQGSVKAINAITKYGTNAATATKHGVDAQLIGLHGSFDNFTAYINGLRPHYDIIITANGRKMPVDASGNLPIGATIHGSFDKGGYVPGPKGRAMAAIVHGGEYVVSNEEQARSRRGGLSLGGGRDLVVHIEINNPTGNGQEIANQFVAALRTGHARTEVKRLLGVT